MTKKANGNCWIYFLLSEKCELIKIGSSTIVARRIAELQGACPDKLTFLGQVSATNIISEFGLHEKFKEFRVHGEWFYADASILAFIRDNCDKPDIKPVWKTEESRRELRRKRKAERVEQKRLEKVQLQEEKARRKEKETHAHEERRIREAAEYQDRIRTLAADRAAGKPSFFGPVLLEALISTLEAPKGVPSAAPSQSS